jgi:ATP-binding cassette subfamily B multidrug efflux pump
MRLLFELSWYFKQQRWRYFTAMLLLTVVALLNLLPPWIAGTLIDEAMAGQLNRTRLLMLVGSIVGIAVLVYVLRYLWRLSLYSASYQLGALLRQRLHERLLYQSADYFHRHPTGDLMARVTNDITAVEMSAGEAVLALFDGLLTGIVVVAVLFFAVDWRLTLIALLPWPFMAYGFWRVNTVMHDSFVRAQGQFGTLNERVQELFSGLRIIRAYGMEDRAEGDFSGDARAASEANLQVARAEALYEPIIVSTMGASFLLAVGGGAWLIHRGEFSIGELTRFTLYLGQLIWPMFAYGWLLNLLKRGGVSYQRIQEVLQAPQNISDQGTLTVPPSASLRWDIKHFRYPGGEKNVLSAFSGTLAPGAVLGIVGPIGSGKSTFLHLLLRQYEDENAQLWLDQQSLANYRLDALHQHFAVVPQEPFLFSTSIAENIRLGCPEASDQAVEAAAKAAALHEDILRFPLGYNTEIGERGVTLSGGQKQRLSIARALLKDAPVLVLDDALSAVDVATERAIIQHLRPMQGKRALIIICHRLSAIEQADEIVVLRQGQVAERGTHPQLMTENGWYARAYRYQQLEQAVSEGR